MFRKGRGDGGGTSEPLNVNVRNWPEITLKGGGRRVLCVWSFVLLSRKIFVLRQYRICLRVSFRKNKEWEILFDSRKTFQKPLSLLWLLSLFRVPSFYPIPVSSPLPLTVSPTWDEKIPFSLSQPIGDHPHPQSHTNSPDSPLNRRWWGTSEGGAVDGGRGFLPQ